MAAMGPEHSSAEAAGRAEVGPFTQTLESLKRRKESGRLSNAAYAVLVASCVVLLLLSLAQTVATGFLLQISLLNPVPVPDREPMALAAAATLLAAPGALWLVATGQGASWHLRLAALYALLNWALRLPLQLQGLWSKRAIFVAEFDPSNALWTDEDWARRMGQFPWVDQAIEMLVITMLGGLLLCGARLALLRLRALERACLVDLHSRLLGRVLLVECLGVAALGVCFFLGGARHVAVLLLLLVLVAVAFVALAAFLHGLWRALGLARAAQRRAPAARAAQARAMHVALLRELACTLVMVMTSVALGLLWADLSIMKMLPGDIPLQYVKGLEIVDALCNEWFALNLSGALSGAARGTKARAAAARERRRRWQAAEAAFENRRREERPRGCEDWEEKVCELAGRGVSLEALLRFFKELPGLMESYTPGRHSTNDVVRGAIVPFTAEQQASCATVLMKGEFARPHKMVTHNWSNLFMDLLAAILADALGESEFSMISDLLTSDLERLEKWVSHAQVGGKTYWVCAFSVNQHVGICGSVRPNAKDTVTGVRPTPCSCGRKKALNDTEPLLPDGRSIPCEMNKFDDMMKYLSAADPAFEQVVAIDAKFTLFSRAWCVAEIATASCTGMLQRLKICTREAMEERAEHLRGIRIQDMEASRKEDKDEILASIDDLDAFNDNLQKLLFQDLFPAWTSLDAEERMASAGTVIRWLPVWATANKASNNQPASGEA